MPFHISTDDSANVFMVGMMRDTVDLDPGPGVYRLDTMAGKVFIIKLDFSGRFKWAHNIGNSYSGYGQLHVDAEGNVIFTCSADDTYDYDPGPAIFRVPDKSMIIRKFDNNGNLLWVKSLDKKNPGGGTIARGLTTDESGNIYLHGYVSGVVDIDPGVGIFEVRCDGMYEWGGFVCKLDRDGNFSWGKFLHCGAPSGSWAVNNTNNLFLDSKKNLYFTGSYTGSVDFDPGPGTFTMATATGATEGFVCKLDGSGNFIWARRMSGSYVRETVLAGDQQDNVYIAGIFSYSIDPSPGWHSYILNARGPSTNTFVMKLDTAGTLKWAKGIYAKKGAGNQNFIHVDKRGHIYLTGFLVDSVFLYDRSKQYTLMKADDDEAGILIKLDSGGKLLGSKVLATTGVRSMFYTAYVDKQSNIYFAGNFEDSVLLDPDASATKLYTKGRTSMYLMKLAQPIPLSLHSFGTVENCTVYPNPTNGPLTLLIDGFAKEATAEVFSISGLRLLSHTTRQNRAELDLSHYPTGMYLIRVSDQERKTYIKVLKQ